MKSLWGTAGFVSSAEWVIKVALPPSVITIGAKLLERFQWWELLIIFLVSAILTALLRRGFVAVRDELTTPVDDWDSHQFLMYVANDSSAKVSWPEHAAPPMLTSETIDAILAPTLAVADEIRNAASSGKLFVWARKDLFGNLHEKQDPRIFIDHDFDMLAAKLGFAKRVHHGENGWANEILDGLKIVKAGGESSFSVGGNHPGLVDARFSSYQARRIWRPRKWWMI